MFYVSIHGTTCFYRLLRLKTLNLVISPRLQHWYISTLIHYTSTLVNWYTGKWYTWYTGKWQSCESGSGQMILIRIRNTARLALEYT